MLDLRKQQLIELRLKYPTMGSTELAKKIGVSRQSIWEWSKQAEVQAELDRRLREINQEANVHLKSCTSELMSEMLNLALDKSTEARVRNSALQYLIDRSMGKAADQVNIDLQDTTDSADVLQGFKDFLKESGYLKKEKQNG